MSRFGAAAIDVTPHPGLPLAGYSSAGERARSASSPLRARALVFEDGERRAAMVVADLMSASRYLLAETVAALDPAWGIGTGELILVGTHTHLGPGNFYGWSLYDTFAQRDAGLDRRLVAWLAGRIAAAIGEATARLMPARVGFGEARLWGWSQNARPLAFARNPEAAEWHAAGYPGHGAPADLTARQRAIDPRVRLLLACAEDGAPLGGLATFACHNTAIGLGHAAYDADWAGRAANLLTERFGHGRQAPVFAVATAAPGDVNCLREDREQGLELAQAQAERVARAIETARQPALANAEPFDLETRWGEWSRADRLVDERADTELAETFCFGLPALGGSEDGPTWVYERGPWREGRPSQHFPLDHPQHPKRPVPFHESLRRLKRLELCPTLLLQTLRLRDRLFATMPGEPTLTTALRAERALGDLAGVADVTLLGYAGDYGGYLVTAEEYAHQGYEAASCLMGRHSARHLQARLESLYAGPTDPPLPTPAARGREVTRFDPSGVGTPGSADG